MSPQFAIPERFQSKLQYVPCTDKRTDAEIIRSLQHHVPVTSEKNIWAYWDKGVASLPAWCQRNVASWVRMHDASWTVRVLDNQPDSPNYILGTLPASKLPEAFVNGTMDGPHVAQASSDFVRVLALVLYGGVYLDVSCILYMNVDWICWNAIIDPTTPFRAAVPHVMRNTAANGFLACRKDDPFFDRWHTLFATVWTGRTSSQGILEHPLLVYEQDDETKQAYDTAVATKFTVGREKVLEYIWQWVCWERLTLLGEDDSGFSPAKYWQTSIMKLQASKEIWGMEDYCPTYRGVELLEFLTTRLDGDHDSKQYQYAENFVFRLLTESSLEKLGRGSSLVIDESLAVLLDQDVNRNKDVGEGTFAALLRYGAENFKQTRNGPSINEVVPSTKTG